MHTHHENFFSNISQNALIITATNRLALRLKDQHMHIFPQPYQGEKILSLSQFSQWLWAESIPYHPLPKRISPLETTLLFDQVIQKENQTFIPASIHTPQAVSAWHLVHHYGITLDVLSAESHNQNTLHFTRWAKEVAEIYRQDGLCDDSQVFKLLGGLSLPKALQAYDQIVLLGFQVLSTDVIDWLEQSGIKWSLQSLPPQPSQVTLTEYLDDEQELYHTATTLKAIITKYPEQKIAVLIPELHQQFDQVQTIFDQVFLSHAQRLNLNVNEIERPYVIAGGKPLFYHPIINQLLQWHQIDTIHSYEQIMGLFQSPFLASQNHTHRAQATLSLREHFPHNATLSQIIDHPDTQKHLDEPLLTLLKQRHKPSGLINVEVFIESLYRQQQLLGWGETGTLSATESEALRKYIELMETLRISARLGLRKSFTYWLNSWQRLLKNTPFQSKGTPNLIPINILELMESSELYYDCIFMLQMHSSKWPNLSQPHPYLPIELQKKHKIPHAHIEQDLEFAQVLSTKLTQQAPQVTISYGKFSQAIERIASPIFHHITHKNQYHSTAEMPTRIQNPSIDDYLRPIESDTTVRGGTGMIKNIQLCPYRASVSNRLNIKQNFDARGVVSAMDKGNAIHKALEIFWGKHRTQSNLKALDEEVLKSEIESIVAEVVNHKTYVATPTLLEVEQTRLKKLLYQWLDFEKSRTIPFEVIAREKPTQITIDKISFNVKIDRMDRLADGGIIVIDYKSGKSYSITDLEPKKFSEPQLAVYALKEKPQAVAIASVHGAKVGFTAISAIGEWIDENTPTIYGQEKRTQKDEYRPMDFEDLMDQWQIAVEDNIGKLVSGDLMVTPSTQSCQYCDLGLICEYREGN